VMKWRETWLADQNLSTCFYPFGGPDFLNAWLFYPKAKTYLLIGLEKAGLVPDLANMPAASIEQGLALMHQGFGFIMRKNFYRTIDMMKELDQSPFTGTVPHILCQMAMLGLKPVAAYKVDLGKDGLTFKPLKPGETYLRIAIEFQDKDGSLKKVIYMKMDLKDTEMVARPGWMKYFHGMGEVSGILKAASYLMHKETFTNIRAICLKNMKTIVEDDSCIPYKYFTKNWDVTLFGKYTGPIKLFETRGQNDLVEAYRKAESRPLRFRYSYNPDDGTRNMMLAKKREPAEQPRR